MKTTELTKFAALCVLITVLYACNAEDPMTGSNNGISSNNPGGSNQWAIPQGEVFDGGPGKDGIPALENPKFVVASEANYLSDNDLVLGYKNGSEVAAYPHAILDWHEIINDKVNEHAFAVTYCPLTGTGIGWERVIDGKETTFGVSGLLYNSNLLPYDRLTGSNWSQMRLDCVNGELLGSEITTFDLIETTWATWKAMYPQTKVVSSQTGYSRNYDRYPYGDYKTNNENIIFPFSPKDKRLPAKERVLGVKIDGQVKVYQFNSLVGEPAIRNDTFKDRNLIIVGSKKNNFISVFDRKLSDGTELSFTAKPFDQGISAIVLSDNEGNEWNIFGEAVSGTRAGQRLTPVNSFIGYWFAWGAFYPGVEIFGM